MVGRDAIAENAERPRAFDLANGTRLQGEAGKKWRLLDVRAPGIPFIHRPGAGWDFIPFRVLAGKIAVQSPKDFRRQGRLHLVADFLQGGPNVLQINLAAIPALADGFAAEVNVHPAGKRKSHDEGRGHQKVGLDALMHAGFEVAVAGKDGSGDQIVFGNGFVHRNCRCKSCSHSRPD